MKRPNKHTPAVLDVPHELMNLNGCGTLRAFRERQAARREFTRKHGLPSGWWYFHHWHPESQRRFIEAGGTPPPKVETTPE